VKIGAKIVRHGRSFTFRMAEVMVPRTLFRQIATPSRHCVHCRRRDAGCRRNHRLGRLSAEDCVHPSPDPAESSVGQPSPNGEAGHGRLPDTSAVEKAGGWWVSYLQTAGLAGHLGNVG
jgi:hypothetical protein